MACGTPVVACPNGAAPEIVDDGQTGFLCSESAALVEAVQQIDGLDRAACRAAVVERFSTTRMVADHLAAYRDMLAQ
jgi:glycosyltransferase involved in cell wall biosynthesis